MPCILSTPMLWTIAQLIYSLHRGNHQLALQEAEVCSEFLCKYAMDMCHQLRLDTHNEE